MTQQHPEDETIVVPMAENADSAPEYEKLITPSGTETSATNIKNETNENPSDNDASATEDLMHGINSFWAIVFPVCVTMVIASVVVVNYRNSNIEASMQTYLVFGQAEDKSGAEALGLSLVNALVIIGAIAILTFGMALLYKFNCLKFLTGYIMFASAAILSFVGGQLVDSVINDQLHATADWPSFLFIMINFGIVGVVSIFYQKGTPKMIQNGYLVMVSVILAWEFSMWPMMLWQFQWTTLIFCFMFAIYDLCAVLTPCGPLKCLIRLIQEKQAPLPGLIYEADVRDGVSNRPTRNHANGNNSSPELVQPTTRTSADSNRQSAPTTSIPQAGTIINGKEASANTSNTSPNSLPSSSKVTPPPMKSSTPSAVENRPRNVAESDFSTYHCDSLEQLVELLARFYRTFSPEDEWKAPQVAEKFVETQDRLWLLIFHKYKVCTCSIELACPVQVRHDEKVRRQQEEEDDKTIKLGRGDFIFYSVLVGRAAIFDFSTFTATFVCIVMGLGGTLFLLSVLHKALPALPISIFLATFFYFWTQYLFIEFCDFMMMIPAAG